MKYRRSRLKVLTRGWLSSPLALLALVVPAVAQSAADSSEPPPGPLLKSAPAMSQWTITFTYPEEQKTNAGNPGDSAKTATGNQAVRPRTIVTTKTGEIIHEETTTVGGTKTEDWQVRGNYYIKVPGNNVWSAYEKTDTSLDSIHTRMAVVLPESGFAGLDWIRKDAYAGKIKTSAGDALVFAPGGVSTVNASDPSAQKKLQTLAPVAYIDAETRLPVTVRSANDTRQFAFSSSPPSSAQILPGDLAEEIKKGDEIRAQRNAAPQREY